MNPLDWLKALYGAVGASYPTLSLCFAIIIGAFLGFCIWKIAEDQYKKAQQASSSAQTHIKPQQPSTASSTGAPSSKPRKTPTRKKDVGTQGTQNTTYGAQSPIMPDNRGIVIINSEPVKPERQLPKEEAK